MSLGSVIASARELTREAASSTARLMDGTPAEASDIRKLLRSASERDKLSGLRAVHALMAQGADAQEFFADIVKNVNAVDFEVRKLVYAYVVRYAEYEPDLALMAINGIQKYMQDQNTVVRALALRAISSIRIPAISTIIAMAIKELQHDYSPIVRVACCQAIGKCYELDPAQGRELLELLMRLAREPKNGEVQGWAMAVLATSFPNRLDLVHKVFRRSCALLPKYTPWCQIVVVRLLVHYSRRFMAPDDPDVELLFQGCRPLLQSLNSAVVVEAAGAYYYLSDGDAAAASTFEKYGVAAALMRLQLSELVLQNVRALAQMLPAAFQPYLSRIYLTPDDSNGIKFLKLRVLGLLADESNLSAVLTELKFYVETIEDATVLRAAMETLAKCAALSPSSISRISRWLLRTVVDNSSPQLVSEALVALRVLLQQHGDTEDHGSAAPGAGTRALVLTHLAHILDNDQLPHTARVTIIWLIGEYSDEQPQLACEVLRASTKIFAHQTEDVRLQMIQLAAKLYSRYLSTPDKYDERVPRFFEHIIYLSKYDANYDNRDRARMFSALLSGDNPELATLLLQAAKPSPSFSQEEQPEALQLGSASLAVGHPLSGYVSLQDWGRADPHLRDESPEPPSRTDTPVALQSAPRSGRSSRSQTPVATGFSSSQPPPLAKPIKKPAMSLEQFLGPQAGESEDSDESDDEEEQSDSDEDEDDADADDDDAADDDDSDAISDSGDDDEGSDDEDSSDDSTAHLNGRNK